MPTTPTLALPYPAPTATPDVPYDLQQLAEKVESILDTTRPRVALYTTTPAAITTTTTTTFSWDSVSTNVGPMYAAGSPTRITATKAGLYLVVSQMEWPNNATGIRRSQFRVNGTTFLGASDPNAAAAGSVTQVNVTTLWQAALNDYLEVQVFQTSGGNLTPVAGAGTSFLKAVWQCP